MTAFFAATSSACEEKPVGCKKPMPANLSISSGQGTAIIASVEVNEADCAVDALAFPTKGASVLTWGTGCSGVVTLTSGKRVTFSYGTHHTRISGILGSVCDYFEFYPPFLYVELDVIEQNDGGVGDAIDATSVDTGSHSADAVDTRGD